MADENWLFGDPDEDEEEILDLSQLDTELPTLHSNNTKVMYFPNVNILNLNEVLIRLSEDTKLSCMKDESKQADKEAYLANILRSVINDKNNTTATDDFLGAIGCFFKDCYTSSKLVDNKKNAKARCIEIELMFNRERLNVVKCGPLKSSWDILMEKINLDHLECAADVVLHHILQHFWSTIKAESESCTQAKSMSSPQVDPSEFQSIKYHGAWAIKRSRDELKQQSGNINMKQSLKDPSKVTVTREDALGLISKLGNDEIQVDNSYNFIINDEIGHFFVRLHDIVDVAISKHTVETQKGSVVTNCLKSLSTSVQLRQVWTDTVRMYGYSRATQAAVLQYVCTFFVKSKQQITREKLGLKPQKNSSALREGLKSKKGKKKKQDTSACSSSTK